MGRPDPTGVASRHLLTSRTTPPPGPTLPARFALSHPPLSRRGSEPIADDLLYLTRIDCSGLDALREPFLIDSASRQRDQKERSITRHAGCRGKRRTARTRSSSRSACWSGLGDCADRANLTATPRRSHELSRRSGSPGLRPGRPRLGCQAQRSGACGRWDLCSLGKGKDFFLDVLSGRREPAGPIAAGEGTALALRAAIRPLVIRAGLGLLLGTGG